MWQASNIVILDVGEIEASLRLKIVREKSRKEKS